MLIMILFFVALAYLVYLLIRKYENYIDKEISRGIVNKHRLVDDKLWGKSVLVEYSLPKGLSPIEIGYLYDMEIGKGDVVCLIYKRAEKGNVSLSYDDNGLTVVKKKSISDENTPRYEVKFWNTFFNGNDVVKFPNDSLYGNLLELKNDVRRFCMKHGWIFKNDVYFSVEDLIKKLIPWGAVKREISFIPYGRLLGFFLGVIMIVIGFSLVIKLRIDYSQPSVGFILLCTILTLGGLWISFLFSMGLWKTANKYTIEPTEEGKEIILKIYGYKKFLEKCDEKQLRAFMKQDPLYLDKVLPYAVALGLENIISERLPKNLSVEEGSLADILRFEKVI